MVLLWIYVGTILFYFLALVCCELDLRKRIPKEIRKRYKSKGNRFSNLIKVLFLSAVPILNLIYGLVILFSEEFREKSEALVYKEVRKRAEREEP